MQKASTAPDHDDIFDELKKAVVNEAMKRHKWEDKVCQPNKTLQNKL